MKLTTRFMLRAGLVLCAAGALGAFGACGKDNPVAPPAAPPPPPPPVLAPPVGLTATPVGQTQIDLAWTDNTTGETGFQVQRCTGAACANFAQVGSNLAANSTSYSDMGLAANTSYSYRARAITATDSSAWTATQTAVTGTVQSSGQFTMVGAGEITTCASSGGPMGTAHAVDSILTADPNAVAFTVGNNLTDATAGSTFATCFDPKWGAFKGKTYYAIGNADFDGGRGPADVYGYTGGGAKAGEATKGWYSFDKENWHVVVLNTSDWEHGPATYGIDPQLNPVPSEQVDWLAADLAAVPTAKCIAVISWERRFYTTGTSALGRNSNMRPMSQLMYQYGVDLMISAKDKLYARFAPMEPLNGTADPAGFRQFIVGTGGRSPDAPVAGTAPATREAYIAQQWGVLKLTLKANTYDWQFINTQVPGGPTDAGTANCHN